MNNLFNIVLGIFIFILLWQSCIVILKLPTYILPSPFEVLTALKLNWKIILFHAKITFYESFSGFLIANLISIVIALIIAFNQKIEDFVIPIAIVIKTMPIIAIAPLLIIWFGPGLFSKIVTSMLVCFFPSLVNTLRGVKCLDRNLLMLFKIYGVNKKQLVKMFILPSILPFLFAALKVSSSLAVVGALVGEFIGSNKGLGFLIISNYYNMNTALVLATVTVSSIMGISFYYIIHFFEKKFVLKSELSI